MRLAMRQAAVFTAAVALASAVTVGTAVADVPTAKRAKLSGSITVSAAASLTEVFTELGAGFEKRHPGTEVAFNFAASSALAGQIQGDAPADVFASADGANMQKVVASGQVTADPVDFAANQLTIVVKKGNPDRVKKLGDLPDLGVVSMCAATVPCGRYANQMLTEAGITIPPEQVTLGQDAKATLTAVAVGDADAAIVYVTDARAAAGEITEIPIAASLNVLAVYPIAPVASSQDAKLAAAWIDLVLSPRGQRALAKHGFLPVPAVT